MWWRSVCKCHTRASGAKEERPSLTITRLMYARCMIVEDSLASLLLLSSVLAMDDVLHHLCEGN